MTVNDLTAEIPAVAGFSLTVSPTGDVATVAFNRPEKRNTQNPATWLALARAVNGLPGTVRALLVRSDGPSFSAGLDRAMFTEEGIPGVESLRVLPDLELDQASAQIAAYQDGFAVFARPDLVSVALVQGHAMGGGFQIALACDVRIASEDAEFAMAEINHAMVPDLGGTKRLVELVGYSRAAHICMTGRRVGAAEAERIGLVSEVVPREQLDAAGDRFLAAVLAHEHSAVTETKALLLEASERTQAEQERAEREAQHRQLRLKAGYGPG